MLETIFAALLLAGALLIALWTDARLAFTAPASGLAIALHAAAATLALGLAPAGQDAVDSLGDSPLVATAGVLGVFFPALVYFFVSTVWVLRAAPRVLAR